jgi:tubulin monoglycylase TTLL3/8
MSSSIAAVSSEQFEKWKKVNGVKAGQKVFIIEGSYPALRTALDVRGWYENKGEGKDGAFFDFLWTWLGHDDRFGSLRPGQTVNHFPSGGCLTTKIGLCHSLRYESLVWSDSVDVNSFFPRCYDLNDELDCKMYQDDFKCIFIQQQLREVLKSCAKLPGESNCIQADDAREDQGEKGTVTTGLNCAVFRAMLAVAEKWLQRLDKNSGEQQLGEEEDLHFGTDEDEVIGALEWEMVSKVGVFARGELRSFEDQLDPRTRRAGHTLRNTVEQRKQLENFSKNAKRWATAQTEVAAVMSMPTEAEFDRARIALEGLRRFFPQAEWGLNGDHDPQNLWIVKPSKQSRGRGIRIFQNLEKLLEYCTVGEKRSMDDCKWVVQKYIENPLVIARRKFDIRQWVVVTCWNPLTVWFYDDCYFRFCVHEYSTTDVENLYEHLTNNSIAKYSEDFDKTYATDAGTEITGNMWHSNDFVKWLHQEYKSNGDWMQEEGLVGMDGAQLWRQRIQAGMKDISISILKAVQPTREVFCDNNYELFGIDYMVDDMLRPWLIEVNCSPACDYSTEVTENIVKNGLTDLMKLVVDVPEATGKTLATLHQLYSLSPVNATGVGDAAGVARGVGEAVGEAVDEEGGGREASSTEERLRRKSNQEEDSGGGGTGVGSSGAAREGGYHHRHAEEGEAAPYSEFDTGKWCCIHKGNKVTGKSQIRNDMQVVGVALQLPKQWPVKSISSTNLKRRKSRAIPPSSPISTRASVTSSPTATASSWDRLASSPTSIAAPVSPKIPVTYNSSGAGGSKSGIGMTIRDRIRDRKDSSNGSLGEVGMQNQGGPKRRASAAKQSQSAKVLSRPKPDASRLVKLPQSRKKDGARSIAAQIAMMKRSQNVAKQENRKEAKARVRASSVLRVGQKKAVGSKSFDFPSAIASAETAEAAARARGESPLEVGLAQAQAQAFAAPHPRKGGGAEVRPSSAREEGRRPSSTCWEAALSRTAPAGLDVGRDAEIEIAPTIAQELDDAYLLNCGDRRPGNPSSDTQHRRQRRRQQDYAQQRQWQFEQEHYAEQQPPQQPPQLSQSQLSQAHYERLSHNYHREQREHQHQTKTEVTDRRRQREQYQQQYKQKYQQQCARQQHDLPVVFGGGFNGGSSARLHQGGSLASFEGAGFDGGIGLQGSSMNLSSNLPIGSRLHAVGAPRPRSRSARQTNGARGARRIAPSSTIQIMCPTGTGVDLHIGGSAPPSISLEVGRPRPNRII